MDSYLQPIASAPSNNGANSRIALSKREKFLSTYVRNQQWSLPDSIIYYILKNPSNSKVYQKMIQSCKYFFVQNPLLVAFDLNFEYKKKQWNTFLNGKNVDINRVPTKFWITDKFFVHNYNPFKSNSLPTLLSKIYQSDVKELIIRYQKIYITDLQFLASKCEEVTLHEITVMNADDFVVGLEKIFEVLPKSKKFVYTFSRNLGAASANVMTSETVQILIQIPRFSNLEYFTLSEISEAFDMDTFYDFIKKNKKTKIYLNFVHQLSQQYQNRLQTIVNEIISTQNHYYKVPSIFFSGMHLSSANTLLKLRSRT